MKAKPFKYMEYKNLLIELLKLAQPDVYVECGTQKGVTFNEAQRHCKKAIAIDIVMQDSVHAGSHIERHEMDSTEFIKTFEGEIDVLFIDADHRKESVLKDFQNLAPFVKEGTGIIIFHDTYPVNETLMKDGYCSNAWEAIEEIRNSEKDYEIFTFPGPWAGLTIMRKRGGKHLHWYTKPKLKPENELILKKNKTDLFEKARKDEIKKGTDLKNTIPKNAKAFELDYSIPDDDLKNNTSDER